MPLDAAHKERRKERKKRTKGRKEGEEEDGIKSVKEEEGIKSNVCHRLTGRRVAGRHLENGAVSGRRGCRFSFVFVYFSLFFSSLATRSPNRRGGPALKKKKRLLFVFVFFHRYFRQLATLRAGD